jgi:hypothetical protein
MSLTLEFDANGVAWLIAAGEVSCDDAIASVRQLYADARFAAPSRAVWDLRAGRAVMSSEEIRRFADHVRANRPEGHGRAAVVAHDDLSFGIARMYELMTAETPVDVQVFRNVDEATRWLAGES